MLEARLRHALDLYEDGKAPLIVVTGGRQEGDRYTEATAGYNWLRRHGVPDEAILKEVQGRNTWESLAAVARFLRPLDVSDVILVSDASHSLRLRGVSDEVGLIASVSPAPGVGAAAGSATSGRWSARRWRSASAGWSATAGSPTTSRERWAVLRS